MDTRDTFLSYLLFAIPLGLTLVAWFMWSSFIPRPKRGYWILAMVPAGLMLWGLVSAAMFEPHFWQRVFFFGYLGGPVLAGLLLTFTTRHLRSLSRPQRRISLGAALGSVVALLSMLGVFWAAGDRRFETVLVTVLSIYGGTIALSLASSLAISELARVGSSWRPSVATVGLVIAFMAATFFFPVEFLNNCLTRTLLPYTLC